MKERKFPLNKIYFYLTEGCNLCCRHCWISPKYQDRNNTHLSLELFGSILKQAKPLGLSEVKLTGGEPLLHPQIQEILEEVRMSGLRLIVETNGLLCTEGLAKEIAACKNPFVSVSLDAAEPGIHEWMRGVSGCFEKTLEGIRNLVKQGLKPQIIMTLMPRNREQIKPMLRLTESLGAGSVKFNLLQPTARGEKMHKEGEVLSIEEFIEIGRWVEDILSGSTNLRLFFSYPLAFQPLSKIFGNNTDGCRTCGILGILGILANGSSALCGIGEIVPELVFGDAGEDSLEEIWDNTPVLQELRNGLPERLEGVCGECLMQSLCLGACIAQNYYLHKSLWAPFWFCSQASQRGLFPQARLELKKVKEEKQ